MNRIVLIVVLLIIKVLAVKAQDPNEGRTPDPRSFVSFGISEDPYFKDYLELKRKNKEDQKFLKIFERKLIVVLAEEDPERIKYFKASPKKLEFYKELIKTNNDLLVKLVPQYWRQIYPRVKNADTILFKKYSECLELSKTKSEEYFTIEFSSLRASENANLFQLVAKEGNPNYRNELLKEQGEYGTFEINLIENFHKPSFYSFLTVTSLPNELDFIVAIQQMGNFFLERFKFLNRSEVYEEEILNRREKLANKVLLIDSFQVERRRDGFSFIKEESLLPYKLADYNKILEAVKNKDTSFVYVVVHPFLIPLGDNSFENTSYGAPDKKEERLSYSHLLVGSEDSEILKYCKSGSRILNKKSFQEYSEDFEIDKSSLK